MDIEIGLLSLPEDLLLCIFDLLEQEDKLNLSSVNKKFRQLYLNGRGRRLVFHLRQLKEDFMGGTNEEFSEVLNQLLHTSISYRILRISRYRLFAVFEQQFGGIDELFGKSLDWYHKNSKICKSLQTLVLDHTPMTELSIVYFFRLFPNIQKLVFIRCGATNIDPIPPVKFNPLKVLWIPIPFSFGEFLEWILESITDKNTKVRFSSIWKERCMHGERQLSIPDMRFQETLHILESHDVIVCQDDALDRVNPLAERLRYREMIKRKSNPISEDDQKPEVRDEIEVNYRYSILIDGGEVELSTILQSETD